MASFDSNLAYAWSTQQSLVGDVDSSDLFSPIGYPKEHPTSGSRMVEINPLLRDYGLMAKGRKTATGQLKNGDDLPATSMTRAM